MAPLAEAGVRRRNATPFHCVAYYERERERGGDRVGGLSEGKTPLKRGVQKGDEWRNDLLI